MSLEIVVEVWQINEVQRWFVSLFNPLGRFCDPTRRGISFTLRSPVSCSRAPEAMERKFAQVLFNCFSDTIGPGINIENFPSIGPVNWPRCNRKIRCGIHVVPPKQLCAGKLRLVFPEVLP